MTDNYIVLDTETTGLNPARDKVLEIGAARIEQGRVVETFETMIDTGVPIPERITELTGITDAMQAEGKKTEEAFREFFDFCKDLPILGHNITFDFSFLKQMAVNLGYSFEKDGIDTLKIARKVLADLPSRRLPDLCVHYGIDPGHSHRALDDALATHELLQRLWKEFGEKEPDAFAARSLQYSAKKQSPITDSQKGYLNDLLKYHRIDTNIRIEDMTKSEASRMIDKIILNYGRMPKSGRRTG